MYENTCLKGMKVLDISSYNSGPIAGQILGDLGADVIKIERKSGDPTRKFGPFVNGESIYYQHLNRNKKGMTLDFSKEEGREIFLELVKKSDVVIENFMAGKMKKLRLDYETLKEVNPGIVLLSITGFGQSDSPYLNRPAFDITTQAFSGIVSLTGPEGEAGVKVGPPICDQLAGYWGALGVLAAVYERTISGEGQHIDLAMADVGANALEHWIPAYGLTGQEPVRCGNRWPGSAPTGGYNTKDGDDTVFISTANDKQAETVAEIIGHPELIGSDVYKTNVVRGQNADYINKLVNEFTSQYSRDDVVKMLSDAGVPCAPVNTVKDIYNEPHYRMRKEIVELEHPLIGKVPVTVTPFRPLRTPLNMVSAGPVLGADTETILEDYLELNREQIKNLKENNII